MSGPISSFRCFSGRIPRGRQAFPEGGLRRLTCLSPHLPPNNKAAPPGDIPARICRALTRVIGGSDGKAAELLFCQASTAAGLNERYGDQGSPPLITEGQQICWPSGPGPPPHADGSSCICTYDKMVFGRGFSRRLLPPGRGRGGRSLWATEVRELSALLLANTKRDFY